MGKIDARAKEYFSDNKRFADLCNFILFDGQPVIEPKLLVEKDTTEVLSVFGADPKQIHIQKWRDLLRGTVVRSFGDVCLVLIGMEAQANIHYAMPVKNMIYDALNYGYQVKEAVRKHRACGEYADAEEFLSGFKASDKLTPVITITVYLGGEEWNAPRKLSDMYGKIDDRLQPFLQDFDAHVLVPREIADFDGFHTSLKQMFEILGTSTDRDAMEAMITSDKAFRELDNETVHAINDFIDAKIPVNKEGKVTDMCKAWKEQMQMGVEQGIERGIEQGIEQGRRSERLAAICNMIELGLTKEQILQKYSEEDYTEAEQSMLVQA